MSALGISAIERDIGTMLQSLLERHTPCSIRVFVTMNEGGKSFGKSWGNGDFYSMLGYVSEWMDIQKEAARIETRQRNSQPAEPEGGVA